MARDGCKLDSVARVIYSSTRHASARAPELICMQLLTWPVSAHLYAVGDEANVRSLCFPVRSVRRVYFQLTSHVHSLWAYQLPSPRSHLSSQGVQWPFSFIRCLVGFLYSPHCNIWVEWARDNIHSRIGGKVFMEIKAEKNMTKIQELLPQCNLYESRGVGRMEIPFLK